MNLSVNILEILEIIKNIRSTSYRTLRNSHYNVRQLHENSSYHTSDSSTNFEYCFSIHKLILVKSKVLTLKFLFEKSKMSASIPFTRKFFFFIIKNCMTSA